MPPANRSLPIDVLRGLTLTLMIVVNNSIEDVSYAPLLHAPWNGPTPTDTVFPTFLFVVGAALSYSIGKYESLGEAAVLHKIARRTVLIFLCGYLVHWFPFYSTDAAGHFAWTPLGQTRIPGVLQRIALCYGIAALVVHYGGRRACHCSSASLARAAADQQAVVDEFLCAMHHRHRPGCPGRAALCCGLDAVLLVRGVRAGPTPRLHQAVSRA